jgi:hypothetical protein
VSTAATTPTPEQETRGQAADGSAPGQEKQSPLRGALLFPELVLAHHRWFVANARYGEPGGVPARYAPPGWRKQPPLDDKDVEQVEKMYRQKVDEFQREAGAIVSAHWCATIPSAVALTKRERGRVLGFLWRRDPQLFLYRATDWVTERNDQAARILYHCDSLALRVSEVLRGTTKRIAMEWIFAEASYLLGVLEPDAHVVPNTAKRNGLVRWLPRRNGVQPPRRREEATRNRLAEARARAGRPATATDAGEDEPVVQGGAELVEIEKYYDRAAKNAARIVYVVGMLAGVLGTAAFGGVIAVVLHFAFGVIDPNSDDTRNFLACYAAGALGAVVSVLSRMRKEDGFKLDYEVGRGPSFGLGSFRPFLGALFGLAVYFALQGEVLQIDGPSTDGDKQFFFFALLAFLAGFSERLTHVVFGGAERTIATALEEEDIEPAADSKTRSRSRTTLEQPQGRGTRNRPRPPSG